MKVLISGHTGFIGSYLLEKLEENGIEAKGLPRASLDLANFNVTSFENLLDHVKPTHFILSSAMSEVDKCKKEFDSSQKINLLTPKEILSIIKQKNIYPVFFSTDYVYNGEISCPIESHPTNAHTVYGQQKKAVEEFIQTHFQEYLILRPTRVLSTYVHPRNRLSQMLIKFMQNETIPLWTDLKFNYVFVEDIYKALSLALQKKKHGIFNLAQGDIMSFYEMGLSLSDFFDTSRDLLLETSYKNQVFLEPRPPLSTLSNARSREELGLSYLSLQEGIDALSKIL